jgi:WD40 repeat protein
VWAVALSSNAGLVASAGADNAILLWESATGKVIHRMTGHEDKITALRFTPDDQMVISASCDKTVRFWTVSTGKMSRQLFGRPTRNGQSRGNAVIGEARRGTGTFPSQHGRQPRGRE